MSRSAVAILSTENLHHNIRVIKERVKPAKVIAMVKANAYGHGIRSVSQRLDGLADVLGVASIDEAQALRQVNVKAPIALMQGVFEPTELLVASTERFHVVFNNITQVEWLEKSKLPIPLTAWMKINTGMGRLGFNLQEAEQVYERLMTHRNTEKPVKIISHFACSESPQHPLTQEQVKSFQAFIKDKPTEYSLCNSGGILNFPECHYHYVRPGIMLYGVSPLKDKTAEELGLKPVMTVQSGLISVQTLPKGSAIGYGARYECPETMPVGIVAFGYGDGYPLTARDGTPVLVNNTQVQLIGRVSMDMIAVDLRACPDAKVGDPVVLWGSGLPLETVAQHTDNLVWDIITGVQNRVKFLWTRP